jgi:hypothetical protein
MANPLMQRIICGTFFALGATHIAYGNVGRLGVLPEESCTKDINAWG